MKTFLFIFSLLHIFSLAKSQNWQYVTTSNSNAFSFTKYITAEAIDNERNIIFAGIHKDASLKIDTTTLFFNPTSNNSENSYIIKLDPNGKVKWGLALNGVGRISSLVTDSLSNIYFNGYHYSNISLLDTTLQGRTNFIAKINKDGKLIYAENIISKINNYPGLEYLKLIVDQTNNLIISGVIKKDTLILFNDTIINSSNLYSEDQLFILKKDQNGNTLKKNYSTLNGETRITIEQIEIDNNDNIYILGASYGKFNFNNYELNDNPSTGSPGYAIKFHYLLKLNQNFSTKWISKLEGFENSIDSKLFERKFFTIDKKTGSCYFAMDVFINVESIEFGGKFYSFTLPPNSSDHEFSTIFKINNNGIGDWLKPLIHGSYNNQISIAIDNNHTLNLITHPDKDSSIFNFPPFSINYLNYNDKPDFYLIQYDTTGNGKCITDFNPHPYSSFNPLYIACDNVNSTIVFGDYDAQGNQHLGNIFLQNTNQSELFIASFSCHQNINLTSNVDSLKCISNCNASIKTYPYNFSPPITYLWNTGDTTSYIDSICAGNYQVNITDNTGNTTTENFTINNPIEINFDTTITNTCFNYSSGSISINTLAWLNPPYYFIWSNGDTTSLITNLSSGNYNLEIINSEKCSSHHNFSVQSNNEIITQLNVTDTICDKEILNAEIMNNGPVLWINGDTNKTSFFYPPLPDTISVIAYDISNNCSDTLYKTIIKKIMPLNFLTSSSSFCKNDTVTITAPLGDSYNWNNGFSTSNQIELLAKTDTNVIVLISNNNGCSILIDSIFKVLKLPEYTITGNKFYCENDTVILVSLTNNSLSIWNNEITIPEISFIAQKDTIIYLQIKDSLGCENDTTFEIKVNNISKINYTSPIIKNYSDTSSINIQCIENCDNITWLNPVDLDCNNCFKVNTYTSTNTKYYFQVQSNSGCRIINEVEVIIDLKNDFWIPNIFSPNNDLNNDNFLVLGDEIKFIEFKIYDRWGNMIFNSNDIKIGWDGFIKGKPAEPGIYVYTINAIFFNDVKKNKSGNFALIR